MSVSLEFLAAQLDRLLQGQRESKAQLDRIEERLAKLESQDVELGDEMTVLTGMVLRYSSEHIAWGGMQRELQRLRERIEALEAKVS